MTTTFKFAEEQRIAGLKYETDRYYLQIGNTIGMAQDGTPVYQIVNKEHGIIEGESIDLVIALTTLATRTAQIISCEAEFEEGFSEIEVPGGELH